MSLAKSRKTPSLLDQVRNKVRLRHYALATERAGVSWVEKFLRFHKGRNHGAWKHPSQMGKVEIEQYLTWLAAERPVAPSTQEQAFSGTLICADSFAAPRNLDVLVRLRKMTLTSRTGEDAHPAFDTYLVETDAGSISGKLAACRTRPKTNSVHFAFDFRGLIVGRAAGLAMCFKAIVGRTVCPSERSPGCPDGLAIRPTSMLAAVS